MKKYIDTYVYKNRRVQECTNKNQGESMCEIVFYYVCHASSSFLNSMGVHRCEKYVRFSILLRRFLKFEIGLNLCRGVTRG